MTTPVELPAGWLQTTLGELGSWSSGGTPQRGFPEYYGGEIPWVKTGDLNDGVIVTIPETITELGLRKSSAKLFPQGTLLIAMYGATIGKLGLLANSAATNQACAALLPDGLTKEVIPYLFWFLRERRDDLRAVGQGGAQPNISQTVLKAYPCPLPPLNEQRRIVAKIEDLTARSQAAKQALDAIPPLLERFRQSVLAAAFRGDLTKQWRQQNPNVEPATELLKRIRQERRHRWEQDYLAQQKAKGKTPKDDKWKEKYRAPEPVDTAGLPELPEGWSWAGLEELKDFSDNAMTDGPFGSKLKSAHYTTSGVRVIRLGNVKVGKFDDSQQSYVSENHFESLRKHEAFSGDLVIAALAEPVGRACLVPATLGSAMVKADCIRFKPHPSVSARCLMHYLNSPISTRLTENLSHGLGRLRINMADLRTLPVALPPESEQAVIVELFEECLRGLETTQLACTTNFTLLERLSQSILVKAFRGELVPQDPNDGPASVLLEQIRSKRLAQSSGENGKKRNAN